MNDFVFSAVCIVTKCEVSRFLLVTKYYSGDKIGKNWMGGACGTNGREVNNNFGGEIWEIQKA
jgi:hypothetical protein